MVARDMRFPCKNLLIVILGTVSGFAGVVSIGSATQMEMVSIQARQAQTRTISAVLPSRTEVKLKNDGSKFGKLSAIDSRRQQLTLVLQNGQLELISISRVEKVVFQRINPITGEDIGPIQGDRRNWSNLPLANLQIQNNGNQIEVKLPCPVSPQTCQEQRADYTIEELSFPTTSKVSLSVSVAK